MLKRRKETEHSKLLQLWLIDINKYFSIQNMGHQNSLKFIVII